MLRADITTNSGIKISFFRKCTFCDLYIRLFSDSKIVFDIPSKGKELPTIVCSELKLAPSNEIINFNDKGEFTPLTNGAGLFSSFEIEYEKKYSTSIFDSRDFKLLESEIKKVNDFVNDKTKKIMRSQLNIILSKCIKQFSSGEISGEKFSKIISDEMKNTEWIMVSSPSSAKITKQPSSSFSSSSLSSFSSSSSSSLSSSSTKIVTKQTSYRRDLLKYPTVARKSNYYIVNNEHIYYPPQKKIIGRCDGEKIIPYLDTKYDDLGKIVTKILSH